jgi:hypothetical protein
MVIVKFFFGGRGIKFFCYIYNEIIGAVKIENEQDAFDLAVELNLISTSVKICD